VKVRDEQKTHIKPDRRHQVACYEDDLDDTKKFFFFPGVPFSKWDTGVATAIDY